MNRNVAFRIRQLLKSPLFFLLGKALVFLTNLARRCISTKIILMLFTTHHHTHVCNQLTWVSSANLRPSIPSFPASHKFVYPADSTTPNEPFSAYWRSSQRLFSSLDPYAYRDDISSTDACRRHWFAPKLPVLIFTKCKKSVVKM